MPQRIQMKRTKGWRKPEGVIYVGRPSHHGNKYVVGRDGDAVECVRKFRKDWEFGLSHALGRIVLESTLEKLRGHDLGCWCPLDQPCHADILLELANQ